MVSLPRTAPRASWEAVSRVEYSRVAAKNDIKQGKKVSIEMDNDFIAFPSSNDAIFAKPDAREELVARRG